MPTDKDNKKNDIPTPVVAKSDDGTIQITFTIPYSEIDKAQKEALKELSQKVQVAGFRQGMAPLDKVQEKISSNELLEKTLSRILPELLTDIVDKEKLKPVIYPKFDLVKANPNEPWEIKATTCEIPNIDLANYKDKLKGSLRSQAIWTPDKGEAKKDDKNASAEEKEQEILRALLENIHVTIPKVLLDEEVNARLSALIQKLEKLGLSLDAYLSSIKKQASELRNEYESKAREDIALELILSKIAAEEKITVDSAKLNEAVKVAVGASPQLENDYANPERKKYLEEILRRRATLDYLTSLTA